MPIPYDFVKILCVVFDDRLNLETHINRVVCSWYANLGDLGRIASKLTKTLKVQQVYFLILIVAISYFITYRNIYSPNSQGFIYCCEIYFRTSRGSALLINMLRYLERLYFLPVKFRIQSKIALLTCKCRHGYVPTYLKNLINSCSVSARYSLRVNDDNWLLRTVTS